VKVLLCETALTPPALIAAGFHLKITEA